MYKIIGTDGKEYGPATTEEIRAWLADGRLNELSLAKPEGATDWQPLKELSELSQLLRSSQMPPQIPAPPAAPSVSGLAIASLVLGILGLVTLGLLAIPGLALGIVALVRVNKNRGRLKGSGFAIAGICVSGAMLLLLPITAAMLLPALGKAKQKAQAINCLNNVKQINLALMMYANDHGDTFPPADKWCDLLKPYTGGFDTVFHCPAEPPGRCSYALNSAVAGEKLPRQGASQLVLIFSSAEGWNQSGAPETAVPHHHDNRNFSIGFVDGHTEIGRADRLRASPRAVRREHAEK